jgi:hypothetical protein
LLLGKESTLTGTAAQVEWAERIRLTVDQEFDRVAKVFQAQVVIQTRAKQTETRTIIAILEQKRVDTLANLQARYFIREWQELSDQVRQLIAKDPRYLDITAARIRISDSTP